jgi:hypothetical protein
MGMVMPCGGSSSKWTRSELELRARATPSFVERNFENANEEHHAFSKPTVADLFKLNNNVPFTPRGAK